ncbi:FecR family protein [Wolinella succinogenes]|uniref:FecR family protein n=1 Tax=Wolinella succinogenes TaxID=844 RepID=UPI002409D253|nr:FecR domain-containing protein [Wolinella succinogenes]
MRIREKIDEQATFWASLEREGHDLGAHKGFARWLSEDEGHQQVFLEEKRLVEEVKALPREFLLEIKNEVRDRREQIKRQRILIKRLIPLSACMLLVGYLAFFMEIASFKQLYVATHKIQSNIILPDDSRISLDAKTSAEVRYYKSKRLVQLSEGKAVFDVRPNSKAPFIIETERGEIWVVGTKFEVVNHDSFLRVSVSEGIVEVRSPKDRATVLRVERGESLSLDAKHQTSEIQKIDPDKVASWQYGRYLFHQASLQEVLEEFGKHIDLRVNIEGSKIASLPISGSFDVNRLDDFLKVLPLVHPVRIIQNAGIITIKPKS